VKLSSGLIIGALTATAWGQSNENRDVMRAEPPMLGQHMARGEAHSGGSKGSSPQLVYHNGPILPATTVAAIFWGSSWSNPSFVGDKINGMDSFYGEVGGSDYAKTSDEYTDTTRQVTSSISYAGHFFDYSPAPTHAPNTSTILNKVCQVIGVNLVPNGYYVVYVDTRRHVSYCAWHSWGDCGGVPIEFGFVFNLDGDAGCDPGAPYGEHSQGLAAIANVSGHELSETRTDPRGTGWTDAQGAENADKCAWSFGSQPVLFKPSSWRIQGNWSNIAYGRTDVGYTNLSGQKGCLDGGQYPAVAR
jgi:hypothetical protein